ncbi:fumarate reductase [Leptospira tipperaryensis]|uniref:Fumarate reductase n=1 Tax=Leptospira tipperaryensis TaxID=2564040 RepID=A0A1D7V360_9LEPT|nr:FAD-binding dehydrogenase [Leptospira tipperaryensis]AOP36274.1 fumarate reductase [Leptospira tipperaryensis]
MENLATKHRSVSTDVLVIGGGLAGIVTALDLLDANRNVVLIDRDVPKHFGGLAKLSFGGIFMVNSPVQRRLGIKDNVSLAFGDWCATAGYSETDLLPKQWAEKYVHQSIEDIYRYLGKHSVRFFPVVHWVERGLFRPGNSVPRFHMVWGTGHALIESLVNDLLNHKNRRNLTLFFSNRVTNLLTSQGRVAGCIARENETGQELVVHAEHTVVASGGIAGDLNLIRKNWPEQMGTPPEVMLNGSHPFAIGDLHTQVEGLSGKITHLDKMWNYAAGVHHPHPSMEGHGLSLVPPKSALWLNSKGERIGPIPLITGFDTKFLVEEVCKQDKKYSWQILNWKIAVKELAVSGAEYNDEIRNKKFFQFLKTILFGNSKLVKTMIRECSDFVVADSIPDLAAQMNRLTKDHSVNPSILEESVRSYDSMLSRGIKYHDDDQLRRIAQLRSYSGDRVRTCKYQKIVDKNAVPLIAIREFILTRKSLGGIQTDLDSRVLNVNGEPIEGLFAVGEAAGFGGGGIHGKGALEGTFLGSCIITARSAARKIIGIGC